MARNSVAAWSTTASDNKDIAGINIDENCDPGNLNDAIRAGMAQIAAVKPIGAAAATLPDADKAQARTNIAAVGYVAQALAGGEQAQARANIGALAASSPTFTGIMEGPTFRVDAAFGFYKADAGTGNPVLLWDAGDEIVFDRVGNDWYFRVGGVNKVIIYEDGNIWSAAAGIMSNKSGTLRWASQATIDFFTPASVDINLGAGGAFTGISAFGGANTDKRIGVMKWRSLQVLGSDGVTWFNVGQI